MAMLSVMEVSALRACVHAAPILQQGSTGSDGIPFDATEVRHAMSSSFSQARHVWWLRLGATQ
jgi:hypothetical protein